MVDQSLEEILAVCRGDENTMYPVLEVVRAYATVGEISSAMQEVFSGYHETKAVSD